MTTSAGDVMLAVAPIVHTPQLARAVQDYRDVMGFEVIQHITGVLALLRRGDVHLHLWQRGVGPSEYGAFKPAHHRIAVAQAFETHADLVQTLKRHCKTTLAGTQYPHMQRLSGAPSLQPWGAWEFSLTDGDGNVLQIVQWLASPTVQSPPPGTPEIPLPWPARRGAPKR